MGNPAKLASMKRIVKKLGIELIGLRDLNCEIPDCILMAFFIHRY